MSCDEGGVAVGRSERVVVLARDLGQKTRMLPSERPTDELIDLRRRQREDRPTGLAAGVERREIGAHGGGPEMRRVLRTPIAGVGKVEGRHDGTDGDVHGASLLRAFVDDLYIDVVGDAAGQQTRLVGTAWHEESVIARADDDIRCNPELPAGRR